MKSFLSLRHAPESGRHFSPFALVAVLVAGNGVGQSEKREPAESDSVEQPAASPAKEARGKDDTTVTTGVEKPEPKPRKLPSVQIPAIGSTQPWVRNTTWVDYFGNDYDTRDDDDGFFAIVNYLNFGTDTRLKKKGFRLLSTSVRLDGQLVEAGGGPVLCDFDGSGEVDPIEEPGCDYHNDLRLERVTMRLEHKHFKLTGGDFNVNFGRGMALSVRKINDIGVDATIKGGRLDIRTKPVKLTGLYGVGNRQQSDFATRTLMADPGYPHALCDEMEGLTGDEYGNRVWTSCSDLVGGARAEGKLPGKIRLGAHYGNIWFGQRDPGTQQHEALHFVGGDLTRARIAKVWDFFGGVTAILRNYHHSEYYPDLVETGTGAYLSNVLSFGGLNVLLEGKYFDNYVLARDTNPLTLQYTEAPTLEREDQQTPAAANATGPLLRVAYTWPKLGLTAYANGLGYAFAYSNEEDMFEGEDAMRVLHTYAGVDWDSHESGTSFKVSGGWRWEGHAEQPEDADEPLYDRKMPHAELYVNQSLGRWGGWGHSFNFKGDWRRETAFKVGHGKHFHKGNLILGYGMAPHLTLALIGGFSSEFPGLENEPQLHEQPCESETCRRKPHLWPGGEIRYNFLTSSFARVFVGRQVGGLICVNGSCRELPDFEGVRFDLVLGF